MKTQYKVASTPEILFWALLLTVLIALAMQFSAAALEGAEAQFNVKPKAPLAIGGYDPVAYFTENKAVKGEKKITTEYHGITYRFSSEGNMKLFLEKPEKFLPAYGGWCASAMAFGRKVEIDPENFIVDKGRLFLFYKSFLKDAKTDWNANQPRWLTDADTAWGKIVEEAVK